MRFVGSLRASFRGAGAPESRRMPLPLGSGVRGCGGADLNRRGYDLTHLSMRVGLYLHPLEMLAIQPKSLKTLFGKSLLEVQKGFVKPKCVKFYCNKT
jgi:hypothetical protein